MTVFGCNSSNGKKSAVRFGLLFLCASVVFVSCGKKEEKKPVEKLNVKIFLSGTNLKVKAFEPIFKEFEAAHGGVVVNATVETADPGKVKDDPALYIGQADVILFPSAFNAALRSRPDAYYPISATMTVMPPLIDKAYIAADGTSNWALPLLIDPVVIAFKKAASEIIGENKPPRDWAKISMISGMKRSEGTTMPHLVFITDSPYGLTDSLAAFQMAAGFYQDQVREIAVNKEEYEMFGVKAFGQAILNLKTYLKESEGPVEEIPQLSNVSEFVQSKSLIAFTRYSSVMSLPSNERDQLYLLLPPCDEKKMTIPCQVAAGALPMEASNPKRGMDFLNFLLSHIDVVAKAQGYCTLHEAENGKADLRFAPGVYFVVRDNEAIINQKTAIDAMNGRLPVEEFNERWAEGFNLPKNN
ncbi:MAG: hypothetical protein AB1656_02680 [Candidatus Omnitrophota bacterium]